MLHLSNKLIDRPVLSLRVGQQVATATAPLINPTNLKIEGFYCTDSRYGHELILLTQDIREQLTEGFVIDDYDILSERDDLVRLASVFNANFSLIGMNVRTVSGQKVGKINDYASDLSGFFIHKLYVGQSIVKSFSGGMLLVDRGQINEITRDTIIIEDLLKPVRGQQAPATS